MGDKERHLSYKDFKTTQEEMWWQKTPLSTENCLHEAETHADAPPSPDDLRAASGSHVLPLQFQVTMLHTPRAVAGSLEEHRGHEGCTFGKWGTKGGNFVTNECLLSLGPNQSLCFSVCPRVFLVRLLVRQTAQPSPGVRCPSFPGSSTPMSWALSHS